MGEPTGSPFSLSGFRALQASEDRMRKTILLITLLILSTVQAIQAAPLTSLFVREFKVTGAANRDELKGALPSLLATRLVGDGVVIVDGPEGADLTATGAYIAFGKVFSLDLLLKDRTGKVVGRFFEQGDSADDIIPAVTRLAQKIRAELTRVLTSAVAGPSAASSVAAAPPPPQPVAVVPPTATAPPVALQAGGDLVRPDPVARAAESGMIGQRLDGAMIGIAGGRTLANGEREIIVALERELRLYRQGASLTLLAAETGYAANDKILGIDTAGPGADGTVELYVTLMRGDELDSQVWRVTGDKFARVAERLPYFFRVLTAKGGEPRLYAQQMGSDADFFGEIREVTIRDGKLEFKNSVKLPRGANIFNVNLFTDKGGKFYFVLLNADGYLAVLADNGEELWRSADRFGGSEAYFTREDQQNVRVTGQLLRKVFLEQRLIVTKNGEIIVPKNDGFWVIGNSRSFSKNSVYSFIWNGAVLEERWHTKPSQNYLADYYFDQPHQELVLLEVVKKAGMIDKGASAVTIKKVE
jgi:hypothetical protein